jgi:hypothetical protein
MKNVATTIFPKLADINFAKNTDFVKKFSNYVEVIGGFENEIKLSLDYYNSLVNCDVATSLTQFYKNLNDEQLSVLGNDFVDFWVKRFSSTVEPLKQIITDEVGTDKNSFFTELSDSIGLLLNSQNLLDDATIPYFDYTANIYGPPNTIPVQLKNKISPTTLEVSNSLSKSNSILMRNNLKKINLITASTDPAKDALTSHGLNLITDLNTFVIINNNLSTQVYAFMNYYKKIYSYIFYLNNIGNNSGYNPRDNTDSSGTNQQIITEIFFSLDVEKIKQNVDLLQKKFKNIISYSTIKNTISNTITQSEPNYTTTQLNQIEGLS